MAVVLSGLAVIPGCTARPGDAPSEPRRLPSAAESPTSAVVPDLTGLSIREAEDDLVAAGLVLGDIRVRPSGETPGTVTAQMPEAGKTIELAAAVDITTAG